MSIRLKLNILFLVLGIVATAAIVSFNYYDARGRIYAEALQKADLVSSFALAARQYTVKTMRPLARKLAGPQGFHPEIMGGFFVARAVAENFSKAQPGYYFKQAALNPVNPDNLADKNEMPIIAELASQPDLKMKNGVVEKDGSQYFYVARPVVAKQGCLKCHGDKASAPKGRVMKYPGGGGYNYAAGSVVAAFFNYVPIEKALAEVKAVAIKSIVIAALSVFLILIVVWYFITTAITRPLINLTELAEDISRGKGLGQDITRDSKDEIGALYGSFNRLRVSVVKLTKMMMKRNKK